MSLFQKLKRFADPKRSHKIVDPKVIESFTSVGTNTFLVSFPRTGSHWLRMLMELYFGRPSLTRAFFYPDRTDYLTLHTHDMDLDVERSHVIYLYRDPVDTIYSQIRYHEEPMDAKDRIEHWSDLYGRHLAKWLRDETFTSRKTVLTYEALTNCLENEFARITKHFGETLDLARLGRAAERVTRDEVKQQTPDDPQVIQLRASYGKARQLFRDSFSNLVWDTVSRLSPLTREKES